MAAVAALALVSSPLHARGAGTTGESIAARSAPPERVRAFAEHLSSVSYVGDLRLALDGLLPARAVVLGDDPTPALTLGLSYAFAANDLDGDGRDEVLTYRLSSSSTSVVAVDGATGLTRWTTEYQQPCFTWRPVPATDHPGTDVLLIGEECLNLDGAVTLTLLRGDTGKVAWTQTVSFVGAKIGVVWLGLARDGQSQDIAIGMLTGTAFGSMPTGERALTIEYRSVSDGAVVGSTRIEGEYTIPTAALAGDIDGDGVDDVLTIAPAYGMTLASGGVVLALTQRLASTGVRTVYARQRTDDTFLIDAHDLSGDGVADPVLLTRWLGPVTALQPQSEAFHLTILDGAVGPDAGIEPLASVALGTSAITLIHPGDISGDGKQDLILGGERLLYDPSSGDEYVTDVAYEAVGVGGSIWNRVVTTPANNRFGIYSGFNPDVGDLDGDGVVDSLSWAFRPDSGFIESAISQRSGTVLWTETDPSRGATIPLGGDADGDGRDDLVDRYRSTFAEAPPGGKPTMTASFDLAHGATLQPMWTHVRTLTLPAGGGTAAGGGLGGRFDGDGRHDLLFAVNVIPSFAPPQRFEECLEGATGSTLWRSG